MQVSKKRAANGRRVFCLAMASAFVMVVLQGCDGDPPTASVDRSNGAPDALELPGIDGHAADTGIQFVEVAASVGLDFVHANGSRGEFEIFEVMGSGVGLIDFDLDGDLDIFLVQSMPIAEIENPQHEGEGDRLYRNDLSRSADGQIEQRFVDVTAESGIGGAAYGFGVAVGDANQDGWPDLYVTNIGPNKLWLNQGDGRFIDGSERCGCADGGMGTSAVFDDLDGDGLDDLFVANYIHYNFKTPKRCTNRLGKQDFCGPTVFEGAENAFFRGRGDGRFEAMPLSETEVAPAFRSLGVIGLDLDGDRVTEILIANDSDPNELWDRDTGEWTNTADFSGVALSGDGIAEGSMGIAVGDYDNDQDLDFLMTHFAGETSTWYGQEQAGLFLDVTTTTGSGPATFPVTGFGTGLFDAQLDGVLDLVIANGRVCGSRVPAQLAISQGMAEPNQFFIGQSEGFVEASNQVGLGEVADRVSRAIATGDLDNDGDVDLIVTNNDASPELWRNESPQVSDWIGLAFSRGPDGGWQSGVRVATAKALRVSTKAGSYLASNDPRVILPCDDGRLEATLTWSDGTQQSIELRGCGRYHAVNYEPESP